MLSIVRLVGQPRGSLTTSDGGRSDVTIVYANGATIRTTARPRMTSPISERGPRRMRRDRAGRAGFRAALLMSDPLLATSKKRLGDTGEDDDDHEKKHGDGCAVCEAPQPPED